MKERSIRLFISSTFKDMNEERDYLNLFVFPRVKEYCRLRHIDFTPIDLRWGITEEQSRNGLVLASCMEEVDNCRPFFVGILGSRYGWMPFESEINNSRPAVSCNRKWLEEKIADSSSITEIEIEYAVFKAHSLVNASFFLRSDDVDVPSDFKEEAGSLAKHKLSVLKRKLLEQDRFPVYTYMSVGELGEILYREIISMIDREFPDKQNDYLTSVAGRHEAALERHAFTLFDVPNINEFLDKWEKGNSSLLLVTGPSGTGTSNYLALITKCLRSCHPDNVILYYDFEMADPGKDMYDDFLEFLELHKHLVNGSRCYLSIDNANLLQFEQVDRIMQWTSYSCPDNMCLIFAASSGIFADSLLLRKIPHITMHGLTVDMQFEFIRRFAGRYGKSLTEEQQKAIVKGCHSNDPTVLTLLLNTLINFGSMEKLDERIAELVKVSEYSIFYGLISEYDKVFNSRQLAGLLAMSCTTIAMHEWVGISEQDILNAFDIKMADWAVVRPAILQFCHANMRSLRFIQRRWSHDIKMHYSTPWQCSVGCRLIDWWMEQILQNVGLAASSVLSIYGYIWHLPYDSDETYERVKGIIVRILLSPDTAAVVPYTLYAYIWSLFSSVPISTTSFCSIGTDVPRLPIERKTAYYTKLLQVAETQARYEDVAWCYRQLSQLYAGTVTGQIFNAYMLMSEWKAGSAIASIHDIASKNCTVKEYIKLQTLKTKSYLMLGDLDEAMVQCQQILMFEDDDIEDDDVKDVAMMYLEVCAASIWRAQNDSVNIVAAAIFEMEESEMLRLSNINSPMRYFYHLGVTFYYFRVGDWESMFREAKRIYCSSAQCYGTTGYQFGRAHILVNYALMKWKGEYYKNDSPRTHSFWAYSYLRPVQRGKAEEAVCNNLQAENEFYESLIREMEKMR